MKRNQILSRAIQFTGFLFAAFSGYLKDIAPPDETDSRFAMGMASFLALVLLLLAQSMSRTITIGRYKSRWLSAAVGFFFLAAVSALFYKHNTDKLTFAYPPETSLTQYIAGSELTPEASAYKERTRKTIPEIVAAYGGPSQRDKVWVSASIRSARLLLIANYLTLTLSLASAIFCVTEGIIGAPGKRRGSARLQSMAKPKAVHDDE